MISPAKKIEGVERVIEVAQAVGRYHGYAIAVHGSLARDIDLVAIPWTEAASSAEDLVEAIRGALRGAWLKRPKGTKIGGNLRQPVRRAHGRRAWAIYGVLGTYVDLSVMPRAESGSE